MGRKSNLIGEVFNRLTVISYTEKSKNGHIKYNCLCDCGNTSVAFASNLKKRSY